jgi:hypothetical protein
LAVLSFQVVGTSSPSKTALKVVAIFKSGNAAELVNYFDENIELVIDSEQVSFFKISSAQAEQILKSFFRKNQPQSFKMIYETATPSAYNCMGNYQTSSENYLVYLQIKPMGGKYLIQKLHLRKDLQKY